MKLIMRISSILAAALIVVGLAFGLSKTSYVQTMVPSRSFERPQLTTTTTVDSTQAGVAATTETSQTESATPTQPEFEREHNESGRIFGFLEVLQNFGVMSLIVLPFALWPWFLDRRKKGLPAEPASA